MSASPSSDGPPNLQHRLTAGRYVAVVSEVGGILQGLRFEDRDLVCRDDSPVPVPSHAGAILAPWPNRIAHGRYRFDGHDLQLPINEVRNGNAIHGLVEWVRWVVVERSASYVTMACTLCPQPGYPFRLEMEVDYRLAADGLTMTVTATGGDRPAPYGVSIHPYFLAGTGHVDEWTLSLDAETVWVFDPAHLEDVKPQQVAGSDADFRQPRTIGDVALDHTFADVRPGVEGRTAARVVGPEGRGVEISWSDNCGWVQVFTLDKPGEPIHRRALAIEPMTCPPNAYRSGVDLVTLQPGERHLTTWTIRAI